MFQNLKVDTQDEEIEETEDIEISNKDKIKSFLKKFGNPQDIILYIVSLMLAIVSFANGLAPFGMAIFAAVVSNSVPVGVVYIVTLIGTLIGFGTGGLLVYILTTLVFIGMSLIFRKDFQEDYNEKRKVRFICIFICNFSTSRSNDI